MIDLKNYLSENNLKLDINHVKLKYKCGICQDILCKPKTAKCCCSFCEICITNHKNENNSEKCPSCSRDFEFGMDVSHDFNKEMKIYELGIKCAKLYCDKEVKVKDMKDHLEICTKDGVRCTLRGLGCSTVVETNVEMNNHVNTELGQHLNLIIDRMDRDDDNRAEQNLILLQRLEKIEEILEDMSDDLKSIQEQPSEQLQELNNQSEVIVKYGDLSRSHLEVTRLQSVTMNSQGQIIHENIDQSNVGNMLVSIEQLEELDRCGENVWDKTMKMRQKQNEMTEQISEITKKLAEMTKNQTELIEKQIEMTKSQTELQQIQLKLTDKQYNLVKKQSSMIENQYELQKMHSDMKQNKLTIFQDQPNFAVVSEMITKLSDMIQKQNEIEKSQLEMTQKYSEITENQCNITNQACITSRKPSHPTNKQNKYCSKRSASIDSSVSNSSQHRSKYSYKLKMNPVYDKSAQSNLRYYKFAIKDINGYKLNNYYFTNTIQLDSYNFKIRMTFENYDNEEKLDFLVCLAPGSKDSILEWPMKRTLQLEILKYDRIHKLIYTFSYDTSPNKSKCRYNRPNGIVYLKSFKCVKNDVVNDDKSVIVSLMML